MKAALFAPTREWVPCSEVGRGGGDSCEGDAKKRPSMARLIERHPGARCPFAAIPATTPLRRTAPDDSLSHAVMRTWQRSNDAAGRTRGGKGAWRRAYAALLCSLQGLSFEWAQRYCANRRFAARYGHRREGPVVCNSVRAPSAWMARDEPGHGWPMFGVPHRVTHERARVLARSQIALVAGNSSRHKPRQTG